MSEIPWAGSPANGVELVEYNGLQAIKIATPAVSALVYRMGAHIAQWAPAGQKSAIFLSEASNFALGTPIRGGIPVITPWFGPAEAGLHGWARTHEWELAEVHETGGEVELELRLPASEAYGPHGAELECALRIKLGASLEVTFTVTNISTREVQPEMALHAYWEVDAQAVTIAGIEGGGVDRLRDNAEISGPLEPLTGQTVDRLYTFPAEIIIHDAGNSRDIVLSSPESVQAVVWNPGVSGAQSNADFKDDDWQKFICVEATRVRDFAPVINPGEAASLNLRAEVRAA